MEEEFVLPEKWAISRNLSIEQNTTVTDWVNNTYKYNYGNYQLKNYYVFPKYSGFSHESFIPEGYTEITFEEFEKYVLKKENMKKLIGYKVKVNELIGIKQNIWAKNSIIYSTNKESLPYFESLGLTENPKILEPIYESQEKVISMGEFNLTIKPEGIFHGIENITKFIETVSREYKPFNTKIHGYDFIVKDMILSKTGCENTETKLSQWLDVWNEYHSMK
jgi:hypothetical protein